MPAVTDFKIATTSTNNNYNTVGPKTSFSSTLNQQQPAQYHTANITNTANTINSSIGSKYKLDSLLQNNGKQMAVT